MRKEINVMPFTKTEKIVAKPISETQAIYDRVDTYKKGPKAQPIPDVTDDQVIGRGIVSGQQCRGELAPLSILQEIMVERPGELRLIQRLDVLAHQLAQAGGQGVHG